MNLNDLWLLVSLAHSRECAVSIPRGYKAAARRLADAKLLIISPSGLEIQLTHEGEQRIDDLIATLPFGKLVVLTGPHTPRP